MITFPSDTVSLAVNCFPPTIRGQSVRKEVTLHPNVESLSQNPWCFCIFIIFLKNLFFISLSSLIRCLRAITIHSSANVLFVYFLRPFIWPNIFSIGTGIRDGQSGVWIPVEAKVFLLLWLLRPIQPPTHWTTGVLFVGKLAGECCWLHNSI